MRAREGWSTQAAPLPLQVSTRMGGTVQPPIAEVPSEAERMLYYSMRHRTQLYLDEAQYRWLQQRAGEAGSIAAVVRELIDAERSRHMDPAADPLLRYLVEESPAQGPRETSVATLDRDLYGR